MPNIVNPHYQKVECLDAVKSGHVLALGSSTSSVYGVSMSKLFSKLPPPPKRTYLPSRFDCSNAQQLKKTYEELIHRPLPTLKSVKKWMDDIQELSKATSEHDALTYIRKTINTRDRKAQSDYLHLIQKVNPLVAPYRDKLNKKLLSHPLRSQFPKRWNLLLKSRQNAVDLFREKNIPLEQKVEETALKYSQLAGGLDVLFKGKKHTLTQMGVYLERTDRSLRQRAWEATARRRYQEKANFDKIFDDLVRLRTKIAKNAGFKNFRDYCHIRYDRFDYTPKHCFIFHDSVEKIVVPALRKLRERRREELNVPTLRPWDLAADPFNRPPMQPFKKGKELAQLSKKIFDRLDRDLSAQFGTLIRYGLLDLDNRPGKEPGGYQHTLPERHLPFIFMNAVGRDSDIRILLHEGGHAFHTLATKNEPILDYRSAPIEFCEVASMSMELLGNKYISQFYPNQEDQQRSTRMLLEGILTVLPWIATIDAFQHWIYTHPEHSRKERVQAWMKLRGRFSDGTDWSGYKHYEELLWHRQQHVFASPFYYIEYGIAQLGALMVWNRSLKQGSAALRSYKNALSLGGSVGLKELFKAAGGKLDFGPGVMKPLVEQVMKRLN
jgi:oligoendopeptidase F